MTEKSAWRPSWTTPSAALSDQETTQLSRAQTLRRQGIPIVFSFEGVHEDDHRPGDEPQKIDYVKMEKVARTIYLTLWEVANRAMRPKVDKQLPAQLMQERRG